VGDLVGSGFVGLVEALAHASPDTSGEALDAYVSSRIRGAMLDYVRSCDDRTQEAWSSSRRLVRVLARLDRETGRPPTEEEIAKAMGLTRGDYRALLRAIAAIGHVPLESVSLDPERDEEALTDENDEERPALDEALAEAIAWLPELQQHILALHHQEGCTPLEIAMVLDIDEERAVELHAEAVHRLRAVLENRGETR
jgi:RNA polymerase sigma factor for flagellar operon FliA